MTTLILTGLLAGAVVSGGCVQMPTEKQSVSDMRPQIAFKAEGERARGARVFVDGLDMGVVADYIDGMAAVRVLSGTHSLQVRSGGDVLLDEKVYLGDGVSRTFIVR
ncbi:MAG: hypothetical protein ACREC3_06800 [Methyloceanibacter sp.]